MPLLAVGLSHATAPLEVLERVKVPAARLPDALRAFGAVEELDEVVVLSTCQRTEVYADCRLFHRSVQRVQALLGAESFGSAVYSYYDDAVAAHLFGVAAGIDSAILGESDILGQVRAAWKVAQEAGTTGQKLSSLFRHALEAGKRSRTETGIGRGNVSLASTVVSLARQRCGSLAGRTALVVGTGSAGASVTAALARSDIGFVRVASRDDARARRLAGECQGQTVRLADLPSAVVDADLVVVATDLPEPVIGPGRLGAVVSSRADRPLHIVDVAVPRNLHPDCGTVPGVVLDDLASVNDFAQRSLERRRLEVVKVRRILDEEVDRFRTEQAGRLVAPVIAAWRDHAEDVRSGELRRLRPMLGALPPGAAEAVDVVTRSVLNKLLHGPTIRLKGEAGNARGEAYAAALSVLFGLDIPPPEARRS